MGQLVVASLIAGLWRTPLGHFRVDQQRGLLLGAVCLVLWQTYSTPRGVWGWLAAGALGCTLRWSTPFGWWWLSLLVLLAMAGQAASEDPAQARQGLLALGLVQIPLALLQLSGHAPAWCSGAGSGLYGSCGKRQALSALWSACVLVSTGWRSWAWLALTGSTGGFVGIVPAALWMTWRHWPRRLPRVLCWLLVVLGVAAAAWLAGPRLTHRWTGWLSALPQGLHPVGFGVLAGGWQAEDLMSRLLQWRDYHNTLLDCWGRFGWLGVVWIGLLAQSLWRQRLAPWAWLWLLMVVNVHSVADTPLLGWLIVLVVAVGTASEEADGVGPISAVARPSWRGLSRAGCGVRSECA